MRLKNYTMLKYIQLKNHLRKVKKNPLDDENYNLGKNYDFSEICITSSAKITKAKEKENPIKVNTVKAEGQKCPVCWKINKNGCERHSCSNKN